MIDNELAWCAGLFEAEGSFYLTKSTITLTLGMNDEETVKRFQEFSQEGKIRISHPPSRQKLGYGPQYRWQAGGKKGETLAWKLYPFWSIRRRDRFMEFFLKGKALRDANRYLQKEGSSRMPASISLPKHESWKVYWMAGIFEGDGSVNVMYDKRGPGDKRIRMSLDMTDEDTVRRFHEYAKVGTVHKNNTPSKQVRERSVSWIWHLTGTDARQFGFELFPIWSERTKKRYLDSVQEVFLFEKSYMPRRDQSSPTS